MLIYIPGVFEDFYKSARRMSDLANRTKKNVVFVVDGVRYVAKPRQSHRGLVKFWKNNMDREYFRRYLTPQAREASRVWIINKFNEVNALAEESVAQ
jgi:hypothetical protein